MTAPVFTEFTNDGIATLTLNRAPVNALMPSFLGDIAKTLDILATDKDVKAVVLTSALKVLSGGFDLKAAQGFTSAEEMDIVDHLNADFASIREESVQADAAASTGEATLKQLAEQHHHQQLNPQILQVKIRQYKYRFD